MSISVEYIYPNKNTDINYIFTYSSIFLIIMVKIIKETHKKNNLYENSKIIFSSYPTRIKSIYNGRL